MAYVETHGVADLQYWSRFLSESKPTIFKPELSDRRWVQRLLKLRMLLHLRQVTNLSGDHTGDQSDPQTSAHSYSQWPLRTLQGMEERTEDAGDPLPQPRLRLGQYRMMADHSWRRGSNSTEGIPNERQSPHMVQNAKSPLREHQYKGPEPESP